MVFNRAKAEKLFASRQMFGSEECQRLGLVSTIVRQGGRVELESQALDLATIRSQTEQAVCRADTKLPHYRQLAEE